MPLLIQQGSAVHPLPFILISSTDHIAPVTGATPTVTLSKDGAAFATPAGAVTEIGNGWYKVAANATDSNTLGSLNLHATATGADPCDIPVAQVVAFNPDDTGLGLTVFNANVVEWNNAVVPNPAVAGVPVVDVKYWNDIAVGNLPTNFSILSIDNTGAVTITSNYKKNVSGQGWMFVMTDGVTHQPKTGLAITSQRSIDGGTIAPTAHAAVEVGLGIYAITFDASDLNGNHIMFVFSAIGADNRYLEVVTQP
jgi:hypothetical protein